MKLFELKDKNNQTTDLFKIENFTTINEVIEKLNKYFNIENDSLNVDYYFDDGERYYNYVYVSSDGLCSFVEKLTEFDEGFQNESDWKVNSSVEVI